MMPTAESIRHVIPNHVLRVGQTVRLDSEQVTFNGHPSPTEPGCRHGDADLEISLENLNQLILELDPTFEPIEVNQSPTCLSPPTDDSCADEDASDCILVARGCSPSAFCVGPPRSIPIPTQSCSPLPPLPCGSVPRRNLSPKPDMSFPHGSLQPSQSNRNSAVSLLSTSVGSDTSYILGRSSLHSNLSLASEDAESPGCVLACMSSSFSDGSRARHFDNRCSPEKTFLTRQGRLLEPNVRGQSSPASLSGSLNDIPVLLVNGSLQSDQHIQAPGPETDLIQTAPVSSSKPFPPNSHQTHFNGSQPSMKFVMDTSRFWFRPHISRADAEALLKDMEAGTFVVRDSTSYRGSFGLAMKVEPSTSSSPSGLQEEKSSDVIRHFLIESSSKGVRIRGSSQEPFFGSLSALVYQHTISAFALPCKLLLPSQDLSAEEKTNDKPASEDKTKTACNFIYLNAVPTETLTGPCAVQKAVSSTLSKASASFTPTVVNLKASSKGVTLTDLNRRLFFRRHYPAHLLSHSSQDPDNRLWLKGCSFAARMFGFVAKGAEAGAENVCHVFAEYDPLQPCSKVAEVIQAAVTRP
ncbi:tensin-4-like [Brachionichthys hirsutus]|uniref:tensin-4-like n=1 Tax=Brachionichthys hirsutus TaxID=412623 RepID=UPI003604EBFD